MTALRPERDSGAPYEDGSYGDGPYGDGRYGDAGAFEAAVDGLADPLNDPLPGQVSGQAPGPRQQPPPPPQEQSHPSPWFRSAEDAAPAYAEQPYQEPYAEPISTYAVQEPSYGIGETAYGMGETAAFTAPAPAPAPAPTPEPDPEPEFVPEPELVPDPVPDPVPGPQELAYDDETMGLRTEDTGGISAADPAPGGGRAARRRAAKEAARRRLLGRFQGGGRRAAPRGSATAPDEEPPRRPLSRVEARRAERARKPSPAVLASRAVGELFITLGVLMLLFVTYQLWWTNIRAGQEAGSETSKIQEGWASGERAPGAFEPGQGFAIMHIPRLDVVVPVAEGISKQKVLDRGMVGHYAEGALKTAMPGETGNFAVAGHRNTHGEPFRYINQLEQGDQIVVETQDKYYVYAMQSILPQTSPSNTGTIGPIPKGSGFTEPGKYITLTTCTPEFTSTYRMIVWGKMVEERPRSKGKPDALVR